MASIMVTVCDICKDPVRETTAWEIRGADGVRSFDLCDEHVVPLAEIYNLHDAIGGSAKPRRKAVARRTPTTRRGPAAIKVTPMDEVEALKGQ